MYQNRDYKGKRDLLLHIPDEIFIVDLDSYQSYVLQYDFLVNSTDSIVGLLSFLLKTEVFEYKYDNLF